MSIFKCKMCGGDLEITQEMSVCECHYCGSKQTLPKLSSEKKNNLYDRAGLFRRNNEYDKAMAIYEQILNEDAEDAESYWSIVLCRYGIEYVEDSATHRRVPTVNRTQMTSVLADEDYKSALKYADVEQRAVYEAEAKEIEQIQKGILAISGKEEPFDVFICYKESDASGRRTPDSVLANDLYHQLTQEGFKVFFVRITLEDKLGSAYEPYIFAALNSAKVMVVLGTKPEYFTAVWVKNEWSRFLAQIKGGADKVLIPAYKDMDPYDLPEEFSHLQAQDMSKLGFMQDLIRGIKKLTGAEEKKTVNQGNAVEPVSAANGAQALVERAFLFLEDGEFTRADELCEQALNQDPKNSKAYVGKLMVERQIKTQVALAEEKEVLTENNYFLKAIRYAEGGLKRELEHYNGLIMDRKYEEALRSVKENGVQGGLQAAINMLNDAIKHYEGLLGWEESDVRISACKERKDTLVERLYQETQNWVKSNSKKTASVKVAMEAINTAIENYEFLGEYQDSSRLLVDCKTIKEKLVKKRKKKRLRLIIGVGAVLLATAALLCALVVWKEMKYFDFSDYERMGRPSHVVIPNYVTEIDENVFQRMDRDGVTSIELPDSVTVIGDGAFRGCSSLTSIELPDGVTVIGEDAFGGCASLTSIELPDGVIEIGASAFYGCSSLTSIELPEGVTEIGAEAFRDCDSLTSIELPKGVTKIGERAFRDCDSLTNMELPEGVTEIGAEAFRSCSSLTSIELPKSVTKIGKFAFYHCSSLASIELPDGVTGIENNTFEYCVRLTSVKLPAGVWIIGDEAFRSCDSLTSIELPDSVTRIGKYAFIGCDSLTSIELPASVWMIGDDAFSFCERLSNLVVSPGSYAESWAKENGYKVKYK